MTTDSIIADQRSEINALKDQLQAFEVVIAHLREHLEAYQDDRKPRKPRSQSRPPHIFFYCRVSHQDSVDSGLGIAAQIATLEATWKLWQSLDKFPNAIRCPSGWQGTWTYKTDRGKRIKVRQGDVRADGIFIDEAISAYRNTMISRPAGSLMDDRIQQDDIVVFSRLDRAFRDLQDFAFTTKRWLDRGASVLFIDPMLDMSDTSGRVVASFLASMAQWESDIKSERIKEAAVQAWYKGIPVGRKNDGVNERRVPGWKRPEGFVLRKYNKNEWVPYWYERAVLEQAILMKERGDSWRDISDYCEHQMAAHEGREVREDMCNYVKGTFTREKRLRNPTPARLLSQNTLERWMKRYQKHPFPLKPDGESQ